MACVTDLQGQELDESAMCDSEAVAHNTSEVQLVLNSVELELLTEAALQLLPRPSIANTLGASRMHPSDTGKRQVACSRSKTTFFFVIFFLFSL